MRRSSFYHSGDRIGALPVYALITAIFMLTPVLMVILQGSIVKAVADAVPIVTPKMLADLFGTGSTGAVAMYLIEALRSVLQCLSIVLTIPLYMSYLRARD